jgi:hypothetical protein
MSRFISAVLLAGLVGGCASTGSSVSLKPAIPPAPGNPYQVHAAWENRIMVTPDVVNNGRQLVGLSGRIYLFGEEIGHPMAGDGGAVVELCDLGKLDPKGNPELLERWVIDKENLKRLLKKDTIGWGYTVFLPWNSYRPDIGKVQLQVRYLPDKGMPLYSPPAVVALHGETQLTISHRQLAPPPMMPPSSVAPPPPAAAMTAPASANFVGLPSTARQ